MGDTLQFKCPVCRRLHPYNTKSDKLNEVTCPDNESSELHEIHGNERTDLLNDRNWNLNRFSTRVSEYTGNLAISAAYHNPHPRKVRNW